MRVRVNFTLEVDVNDYNENMGSELDKVEIRQEIQNHAQMEVLYWMIDQGVKAKMLGVNNVYDPRQKLTVAEHLVRK